MTHSAPNSEQDAGPGGPSESGRLDPDASAAIAKEPSAKNQTLGLLILSLAASAMLWGCWNAPFFGLDDEQYLSQNRVLTEDGSWTDLLKLHRNQNFYYPLTLASWKLDRILWQDTLGDRIGPNAWPAGIRIGNLLLHLLASFFLWRIFLYIRIPLGVAMLATCGFAIHPYACEIIAWPIERKSALATCLGFAALLLYLRANSVRGHLGAALCYGAALLSKPSALGVFAIVGVWELFRIWEKRYAGPHTSEWLVPTHSEMALTGNAEGQALVATSQGLLSDVTGAALRLLPWLVLSGIGLGFGFYTHRANVLAPPGGSMGTALLTDAVILPKYFSTLAWPTLLSAYYFVSPVASIGDLAFWKGAALLGAVVGGSIFLSAPRWRSVTGFAWLWFLGALGPHLNLIALGDLMHDRFLYFSTPAFWLALGLGVHGLFTHRLKLKPLQVRWGTGVLLAALCFFWTSHNFKRGKLFRHIEFVLNDAVLKEPQSSSAHLFRAHGLKNKYVQLRDPNLAVQALQGYKLGMACPDYDRFLHKLEAQVNTAQLCFLAGRLNEAQAHAREALKEFKTAPRWHHKPLASKAVQILGEVALEKKQLQTALLHFENGSKLDPSREILYFYLGRCAVLLLQNASAKEQREDAEKYRRKAINALRKVSPRDPQRHQKAKHMLQKLTPHPK